MPCFEDVGVSYFNIPVGNVLGGGGFTFMMPNNP